eukprot:691170-Pyramimonas_sp.AAC.1
MSRKPRDLSGALKVSPFEICAHLTQMASSSRMPAELLGQPGRLLLGREIGVALDDRCLGGGVRAMRGCPGIAGNAVAGRFLADAQECFARSWVEVQLHVSSSFVVLL